MRNNEPLLCHSGHSLLDYVLLVNARSNREVDTAAYVLRPLHIDSFKSDHLSHELQLSSLKIHKQQSQFHYSTLNHVEHGSNLRISNEQFKILICLSLPHTTTETQEIGWVLTNKGNDVLQSHAQPSTIHKANDIPTFMYFRSCHFEWMHFLICCPQKICVFVGVLNCPGSLSWHSNR